jgi:hypothetical protein
MENGIQDEIKTIGTDGCYALCLLKIAETATDIDMSTGQAISYIEHGIKDANLKADMTVVDGAAFLGSLTGFKWTKDYAPHGYKPQADDFLVAEWFNPRTGFTHFTLVSPQKWDSLESSVTVKEGFIRGYRVYRQA